MGSASPKQALLITGRPGSGKTTLLMRALDLIDRPAGGFITVEVREAGRRMGFDIVTLDGRRTPLARAGLHSPVRVGRYGVDLQALEAVGVASLRSALEQGRLLVVDEIGKMELASPAFRQAVTLALEQGAPLLGTVMLAPHPFADALKRDPRVRVVDLTRTGHDAALEAILEWSRDVAGV